MPTGTPDQVTQYVYGVTTTGGSGINSNNLLAEIRQTGKTTGAASTLATDRGKPVSAGKRCPFREVHLQTGRVSRQAWAIATRGGCDGQQAARCDEGSLVAGRHSTAGVRRSADPGVLPAARARGALVLRVAADAPGARR